MLRALVAVLVLANLGFWAWSAGALDALGLGPHAERDPGRLAQQLRPDSVRVLSPQAAATALSPRGPAVAASPSSAAASIDAVVCLEAGPFSATAADDAERALSDAAVPATAWQRLRLDLAAQYGVVLGPFNSRESLQLKREELARLRLDGEEIGLATDGSVATTAGRPALALGRYDSRGAADTALAGFSQRGVRTARVAQLRLAGTQTRLRVEAAPAALAEQLRALSGPVWGAGFTACAPAR